MKTIPLTQGKFAIVDDEDYEWLNQWKWCADKIGKTYYAVRTINHKLGKQMILMHRQILRLTKGDGKLTDHRNHNGLNNRKCNLRICTHNQNHQNRRKPRTLNRYKGVSWHKPSKRWCAHIIHNKKYIHLGYFDNEIKAAKTYDKKAKELFGEFACLNFSKS